MEKGPAPARLEVLLRSPIGKLLNFFGISNPLVKEKFKLFWGQATGQLSLLRRYAQLGITSLAEQRVKRGMASLRAMADELSRMPTYGG